MTHSGQLSARIATRSPARTPIAASPPRIRDAACAISFHEWSRQAPSRLDLSIARSPKRAALRSNISGIVANVSAIGHLRLTAGTKGLLAELRVRANRASTTAGKNVAKGNNQRGRSESIAARLRNRVDFRR